MTDKREMTRIQLVCDHLEVIIANSCLSESLRLGPIVLNGLPPFDRRMLSQFDVHKPSNAVSLNGSPARACLSVGMVKRQTAKHLKGQKRFLRVKTLNGTTIVHPAYEAMKSSARALIQTNTSKSRFVAPKLKRSLTSISKKTA